MSNIKNTGWENKGQYTIQTKTLWGIACLVKPHLQPVNYTPAEITFIIERMEAIGYANLNSTSVKMYLDALNGRAFQRLKHGIEFQRTINKFRINTGLSKINFK
jgi:hypothetical protein